MTTLTIPRRFISLLVIATAVCAVLAAVTSVGAVDIIFGLPLAFVLPGAALVWAVDPWRRQVKGAERAMWSVGSSIGIVILGGLLLNLTGGLTRQHWLILSSAVVAVVRRGRLVARRESHRRGTVRRRPRNGEDRTRWVTSLSLRPVALLLAAVLVVSGALVLSQRTSAESSREHFVQAWILPRPIRRRVQHVGPVGRQERGGESRGPRHRGESGLLPSLDQDRRPEGRAGMDRPDRAQSRATGIGHRGNRITALVDFGPGGPGQALMRPRTNDPGCSQVGRRLPASPLRRLQVSSFSGILLCATPHD